MLFASIFASVSSPSQGQRYSFVRLRRLAVDDVWVGANLDWQFATFDELSHDGQSLPKAVLRTGVQRLRPVVWICVTPALGLKSMMTGPNLTFFTGEIVYRALSSQGWVELSSAITVGLGVCNCSHIAGDTIVLRCHFHPKAYRATSARQIVARAYPL